MFKFQPALRDKDLFEQIYTRLLEILPWLGWLLQLALDYGILIVYLWGLGWLAFSKEVKEGPLKLTNFWINTFCLSTGIALFILALYFRWTGNELMSMAADVGNAIFYWILLFSKVLDVAESSVDYRRDKSKKDLFHTARHTILLFYKVYKVRGAWYLVKVSLKLLKLNKIVILLIGWNLSSAFVMATALVASAFFIGYKRRSNMLAAERRQMLMTKASLPEKK